MTLGEQLHIGAAFELQPVVAPVENYTSVKPKWGFWTSSFVDGKSAWVDAYEDMWGDEDSAYALKWHLLTPDPTAKILVIDTLNDLKRLLDRHSIASYDGIERHPDFEAIAREYDALHLTEEGQWKTRLSCPDNLYGWDTESTLWFRWKFLKCVRIEPAKKPEEAAT